MSREYHCSIEVRGYELDSFGHVNHAVYVSYCEHARWKLLEQDGVTLARFSEWQRWPVIAGIELSYLKPTFLGDKLDIKTVIAEVGKTSFAFEQTISRAGEPVVRARVRAVMINEKGRPSALPEHIKQLWGDATA